MPVYLLATCIFVCTSIQTIAQSAGPARYKDFIAEDVNITKNVSYRLKAITGTKKKYALMDIYEAKEDSAGQRPLVIWIHGGGFKYGHKKSAGIPLWSKTFARRGYISAAINYRLSKKRPVRRFPDLVEGCLGAIEDVQAVVDFFKTNYRQYRVDTNRIVLAGNSAGAMVALQAVYSNPGELTKLIGKNNQAEQDKTYNPSGIKVIINFWGALFDSSWLQHASVPIVTVHGSGDKIVPYGNKGPLNGAWIINRYAGMLGIPVALKTYAGYGHELQKSFNPFWAGRRTKKRWLEAGRFAADFVYAYLFTHPEGSRRDGN